MKWMLASKLRRYNIVPTSSDTNTLAEIFCSGMANAMPFLLLHCISMFAPPDLLTSALLCAHYHIAEGKANIK